MKFGVFDCYIIYPYMCVFLVDYITFIIMLVLLVSYYFAGFIISIYFHVVYVMVFHFVWIPRILYFL